MRKSNFKAPKPVLVFNSNRILIALVCSVNSAAQHSGGKAQAISYSCTGKYISTSGFYYRHEHPDIEIEKTDLGALRLEEYDKLCGELRKYHPLKKLTRRRNTPRHSMLEPEE